MERGERVSEARRRGASIGGGVKRGINERGHRKIHCKKGVFAVRSINFSC